jgi:hypothetical protein
MYPVGKVAAFLAVVVLGTAALASAQGGESAGAAASESSSMAIDQAPQPAGESSRAGGWFRDHVSLSAGIKLWLAKWQNSGISSSGGIVTSTSEWAPLWGPTVTASVRLADRDWFNSVFANFTWLQARGIDFDPSNTSCVTGCGSLGIHDVDFDTRANRRDYTISGGLSIWKGLGVFAGYYNTQQNFTLTGVRNFPLPSGPESAETNLRIRGPIVGVFGTTALSESVGLYGNVAYGILNYQSNFGSVSTPFTGTQAWSSELGVNISGPEIAMITPVFQIGFRAQVISINTNNPLNLPGDQHRNDITWGPTFSLMASF